jgi:CheY-like chemotaxis protein
LNYTSFAIDSLREEDPLRADLVEVKKAGDRAAALTKQLLAFGRRQVLEPRVLDLNDVIRGLEKLLRRILGEDVDIVQDLAPDLGRVMADPGQIEQVIMNIVVNARDAMASGGQLRIESSDVDLDDTYADRHVGVSPGAYVVLAITDTGCGMDPDTQSRLFEPFFTTKEKGKGTGLGLSTAYGIVRQTGGSITAYSELGRGSTFKVYLPRLLDPDLEPHISVHEGPASGGTETILVVEDDETVRQVAARMLKKEGYQVLTASSGGEALLICEEHPGEVHLLLTDVVMPRMGGRELADRLRKVRPDMRVAFMSGYTEGTILHHGSVESGTVFIAKPFERNVLKQKVREALDRVDETDTG